MNRFASLITAAVTVVLFSGVSPISASTSTQSRADVCQIELNGTVISRPASRVFANTTYIPIWYMMQALERLGIQSSWDGTTWALTTPVYEPVNLDSILAGTGSRQLVINGTVVKRVNAVVAEDTASGQMTTYMPIWYVQQLLQRLGITCTWNKSTWSMTFTGLPEVVPEATSFAGTEASVHTFVHGGQKYVVLDDVVTALHTTGMVGQWSGENYRISAPMFLALKLQPVPDNGHQVSVNGIPVLQMHPTTVYVDETRMLEKAIPYPELVKLLELFRVSVSSDAHSITLLTMTGMPAKTTTAVILGTETLSASALTYNQKQYLSLPAITNLLRNVGIMSSITAGGFELTVPGYMSPDLDNLPKIPTGTKSVRIDGIPVAAYDGDESFDPLLRQRVAYLSQETLVSLLSRIHLAAKFDLSTQSLVLENQLPPKPTLANVVNPKQTYTYTQMVKDMQALARQYPGLVSFTVIGETAYHRPIYAVSLGKGPVTALVTAAHHGREWITTNLTMYAIDQYAKAYMSKTTMDGYNLIQMFHDTTLWFVPMGNPDGVTLSQFGPSAFPTTVRAPLLQMNDNNTNFTHWKANAEGVDPNRQYDGGWDDIWVSPVTHPSFENYKGKAPYSIAETKAILKLIQATNPQMEVSFHSSGELIYFAYRVSGSQYETDKALAKHLSEVTGYALYQAGANPSGGGLTDWWTEKLSRPGFTIEVAPYIGDRPVPLNYFDDVWRHNRDVALFLAKQSYALYQNSQG